jgi:YNFM family putative membrane transporter
MTQLPVEADARPRRPQQVQSTPATQSVSNKNFDPDSSNPGKPATGMLAVFVCGMFAFIDLYCVQPVLPVLAHVFHASEAAASLTISASTFGVALSAILLAVFAEKVDRKRTIMLSMLLLAVCTLLTATATSLPALAFWRFLQGLLTPGVFIITIAYVTEEWPAARVPRVMSLYVAGTVFGGFMGRLSGGLIAEHYSWRPVFVVLGLFGLAGAALASRLLPPARPSLIHPIHPSPAIHDRANLSHALPTRASRLSPLIANLRNPRLLATFGIGFCMLFTLVSVFSYITFYLAAPPFGLSPTDLSWLFAVYLLGLLATLAVGTVLARVGLRHGMLAAVASSLVGVGLTLIPSLVAIGLGLAFASSGVFIAQTCANSFLRDAAPAGSRVSAAGLYICAYYIGGTVGGILPGLAWKHFGWTGCVTLTAVLLVAAGLLAFFGWRHRPPTADPIAV